MSPKEKAQELIKKIIWGDFYIKKEIALLLIDEIMKQFIGVYDSLVENRILMGKVEETANYKYWIEVKQELEEL